MAVTRARSWHAWRRCGGRDALTSSSSSAAASSSGGGSRAVSRALHALLGGCSSRTKARDGAASSSARGQSPMSGDGQVPIQHVLLNEGGNAAETRRKRGRTTEETEPSNIPIAQIRQGDDGRDWLLHSIHVCMTWVPPPRVSLTAVGSGLQYWHPRCERPSCVISFFPVNLYTLASRSACLHSALDASECTAVARRASTRASSPGPPPAAAARAW